LFLNHVFKLYKGFRVRYDFVLLCLLEEQIIIKLRHVIIHVLATCVLKMFIVKEKTLLRGKLNGIYRKLAITDINKYHIPLHFKCLQLLDPIVTVLCRHCHPVIHQMNLSKFNNLSAFSNRCSFTV